jgi:hypothetical protein
LAFIKQVAIASKDPASKDPAGTAEFYKDHVDLKELYRRSRDTGDDGVWLSDGYIYFAILKHGGSDAPHSDPSNRGISAASTISGSWSTIRGRPSPRRTSAGRAVESRRREQNTQPHHDRE